MLSIKSRRQIGVIAGLVGVVILLVLTAPDSEPELEESIVPAVQVAMVGLHDLLPTETVSGRLEPARKAALHFELAGQVSERPVEPGQAVGQGAPLLQLASG